MCEFARMLIRTVFIIWLRDWMFVHEPKIRGQPTTLECAFLSASLRSREPTEVRIILRKQ